MRGVELLTASLLRLHKIRTELPVFARQNESVYRQFFRLLVGAQLEAIGEQRLQHETHLVEAGFGVRFGDDVVMNGVEPWRSAGELKWLHLPGPLDHVFQSHGRDLDSAARAGLDKPSARRARRALWWRLRR